MGDSEDDYQKWAESLNQKVASAIRSLKPRAEPPTIFRVPAAIREANPAAYTPKVVSIGPYHYQHPKLQPTNGLKLRYLKKILDRNASAKLEDYLKSVGEVEAAARSSYAENTEGIEREKFVEMMLLDGCFIVELLLMESVDVNDADDAIQSTAWALPLLLYDLLMLENQIPFFILNRLFCLATAASPGPINRNEPVDSLLIDHLLRFFRDLLPGNELVPPWKGSDFPKFHHILHFYHSIFLPAQGHVSVSNKGNHFGSTTILPRPTPRRASSLPVAALSRVPISPYSLSLGLRLQNDQSRAPTPESIPCATKLKESGVKFMKKERANSFLDVTFEGGTMAIPTLQVYDNTSTLFPNLIAFEQCFPKAGTHMAAYALLMDCLVDTAEDVALLHRRGCIVNGLGSDDAAATLFNILCKGVAVDHDSCYLAPLLKDVKKHCDSRWNRWRAKLMRDYFSSPWSFLSLAGALIVIFLTAVQTAFAVLAYFRPPPN